MEDNKKQAQQKYMEFQMLVQQMQQVDKQLQTLQQQIAELNLTTDSINEISKTPVGKEILVPINSGIFIKAELKENKELIVNVGSNTTVTKTIANTQKLVEEQKNEIVKYQQELLVNKDKLNVKIHEIQEEMKKIV